MKLSLAKFEMGVLVATPGALQALLDVYDTGSTGGEFVVRHLSGDWGELDSHDVKENELALKHGNRILSAYKLSSGVKIWIITEADRSVTTILLPEEY